MVDHRYKFQQIKVYSSDEWMSNSEKRYRNVFDVAEIQYVRAELSFFNKFFDRENWECKVTLKAFRIGSGIKEELCSLETVLTAPKEESIIFLRDGWGNPDYGSYWKEGNYEWEAFIDGVSVGSQGFNVNDIGFVSMESNPYFDVEYVRFYTGDFEEWKDENRKYLKQISSQTTKYLWCEMKIKNKSSRPWNYELFFNYLDRSGQMKAQTQKIGKIPASKENWSYKFDVGWGHSDAGSWKDSDYILNVVFMDELVASVYFVSGEVEIEGEPDIFFPQKDIMTKKRSPFRPEKKLNETLDILDGLVGAQKVSLNVTVPWSELKSALGKKKENKPFWKFWKK
jgi:hypothetical protein